MTASLVRLEGVTKRFTSADVLFGVDLEVAAGEATSIVGPSGSGKSTLLNIIGALVAPSSGHVEVAGKTLASLDANALAKLRNESIGFVFQSHHLLPQLTALENVLVPSLVHDDSTLRSTAPERACALLAEVGLEDRMQQRPAELSGGECQRIAVVRALINEPSLILADEPTGSLDRAAGEQLGDLLRSLSDTRSVGLVTVTHSDRLAERMHRVLELRDGRLATFTAPA